MKQINWSATGEEIDLISKIANRAVKNFHIQDKMNLTMDISATHLNGTPLDLQKFLDFDDSNFMHDIYGIMDNINRRTGELDNCFLPRCSKHDK